MHGRWARPFVLSFVIALLVQWAAPARAAINIGFQESDAFALATDIVEVVEVEGGQPGAYRVVSVWRGGLEAGFVFEPGEIELSRAIADWEVRSYGLEATPVWVLEPTSVVLFLRDGEVVEDERLEGVRVDRPVTRWLPANRLGRGSFGKAALYLYGRRAYELQQFSNPGPLHPVSRRSTAAYHALVRQYDQLSDWLVEAEEVGAADEMVEVYALAIEQGLRGLVDRANGALSRQGPGAIDAIRRLRTLGLFRGRRQGPAYRAEQADILNLMAAIDRRAVFYDMLMQVEASKRHFDRVLEGDADPWAAYPAATHRYNRQEYELLGTALRHMRPTTGPRVRELIRAVRDQWLDERLNVAVRNRYNGLDVVALCDALLEHKAEP